MVGMIIVCLVLLVYMMSNRNTVRLKPKKTGQLKEKYSQLVSLILDMPGTSITGINDHSVEIVWRGDLISANYRISQINSGHVTISWSTDIFFAKKKKIQWKFPEAENQEKIFKVIHNEIGESLNTGAGVNLKPIDAKMEKPTHVAVPQNAAREAFRSAFKDQF